MLWPCFRAYLWYLLMWTSWSCGLAPHNQDWDPIPKSWNKCDSTMTQWKPFPWLHHYWNEVKWSRMTSCSQLIFDKLDSIHSRTEKYKNHSHTSFKKIEFLLIKKSPLFKPYQSLNTYKNITLMELSYQTDLIHLQNWPKTLIWEAQNLIQTSFGS
jgi:hypothetical protein